MVRSTAWSTRDAAAADNACIVITRLIIDVIKVACSSQNYSALPQERNNTQVINREMDVGQLFTTQTNRTMQQMLDSAIQWGHTLMLIVFNRPDTGVSGLRLPADFRRSHVPTSIDGHVMCVVRRSNNTFGDRCFASAGPRLWNRLPPHLRQCDSLGQFKRLLKTHLFGSW